MRLRYLVVLGLAKNYLVVQQGRLRYTRLVNSDYALGLQSRKIKVFNNIKITAKQQVDRVAGIHFSLQCGKSLILVWCSLEIANYLLGETSPNDSTPCTLLVNRVGRINVFIESFLCILCHNKNILNLPSSAIVPSCIYQYPVT